MEYYVDIETDSLSPKVIWCVGVEDSEGNYEEFREAEALRSYLTNLNGTSVFYAHNGIRFDYPVLRDLWDIDLRDFGTQRDTMVMSKLAMPRRDGGHSLDNLGSLVGHRKIDFHDYSRYSEAMSEYLRQDCKVLGKVVALLHRELKQFSEDSVDLEHKVAEIIHQQELNGWLLDSKGAYELLGTLKEKINDATETVRNTFRPKATLVKEITPKVKKDGTLSVVGLKCYGDHATEIVGGPFSRIEWQELNLGSGAQVGERLVAAGWKPTEFTEKTKIPVVNYETLEEAAAEIPEAKAIYDYLLLDKRRSQVESWVEHLGDDGRVHGRVDPMGAVTGRMTHNSPNVAQVPSCDAPWGHECRSLWIAPEGYCIVGADASGLELRMLAHYMNDPEYIREILEGDIHWTNTLALGFFDEGTIRVTDETHPDYNEHKKYRNIAKTFIYALIYGAGDPKIGSIVGGGRKEGEELKAKFLAAFPALEELIDKVQRIASNSGSVPGLDGRRIPVDSLHSALNRLLQGGGAIVMKKALTIYDEYSKLWSLDAQRVGNIHDELQDQVLLSHSRKAGILMVESIKAAGTQLNMRCPLDGEYKIGPSWAETH